MLLIPYTLAHLDWNLSGFPCVNPQPLYLESTQSSTLGWDSAAWPWPPLLFQTHQLKPPGHVSELLVRRRKLGRSTLAISAGTGGQCCCA